MKNFLFFTLLLINLCFIQNQRCGADQIKLKPKPISLKSRKNQNLSKVKADSYSPLTIGYDFSTLQKPSSMSSTTFNTIKSSLISVSKEFSKIIKIQHEAFSLTNLKDTIMSYCGLSVIGADYENFLTTNDVIIFPQFDTTLGDSVIAAAGACIIEAETTHPYGGVLYINQNIDFSQNNIDVYMKNVLLHEITHILIFSPGIYTSLGLNNTLNGVNYITSQNVLARAREHFNCQTLPGVPLESQGGTGTVSSHWESRYMLGDYMVSTDFPDSAISDITLALFEDSGFYKVNYYSGGLFKFGKNEGCGFFSQKCIENEAASFDEFCAEESQALCSSSRTIKTSCYLTTYSSVLPSEYQYFSNSRKGGYPHANYCPVPYETRGSTDYFPKHCQFGSDSSNYGEALGSNSFCFMSSIVAESSNSISQTPVCYAIECDSTNQIIIVNIGDQSIECPTSGGTVTASSGLKGSIVCPAYSELCPSDDIVCNDMYTCFTKYAEKDNYDYSTSPYNYEGTTLGDDDDDDEDFIPVRTTNSSNLRTNLVLILAICLSLLNY